MFSRSIASCIATPATTARAASSSRVSGTPNIAITASPMYLSTTPPRRWISRASAVKYEPRIARSSSGSRRSPSGVDPEISALRTVTTFRSDVASFTMAATLRAPARRGLRRDGYRLWRLDLGLLDDELAVHGIHADGVARVELALEQHLGEWVGDLVLDLSRELLAHALQLELHDLPDLGLRQWREHDRRVDAVEELRAEEALHLFLHALLHALVLGIHGGVVALALGTEAERALALEHLLREVARHDDDRVAEVDGAALRVRQTALIEDLQQDVEDLGVRLLDLVEQDHAVRLATDGLRELSALFVADVARRRSDQA